MSYYIDGRDVASNHTQSTKTKAEHREINEKSEKKQVAQIIQTGILKMSKQQCINANQ